jgi:hypothetical protein
MAFEYKPEKFQPSFDPERCKASVHEPGRGVYSYQCKNRPVADGWCKLHHPDRERFQTKAEQKREARQRAHQRRAEARENLRKAREALDRQVECVVHASILDEVVNGLREAYFEFKAAEQVEREASEEAFKLGLSRWGW